MAQKLHDARGDAYTYTEEQSRLEAEYLKIVTLLKKAGFDVKYSKYWTWENDQNPGSIQLIMGHERVG